MKAIFLLILFFCFLFSSNSFAQDSLKVKAPKQKMDSISEKGLFELSFGSSLLFISNSTLVNVHTQAAIVIPTSAVLFFAEFRPYKILRIPVFFNLATESKQFLVNNLIINEHASPTFGTGLECKVFHLRIDEKSKLEFEAGPLASFLFTTKNQIRFAPVLAGRIRLIRKPNFIMYMGSSYSLGINSWGILFGTGTVF